MGEGLSKKHADELKTHWHSWDEAIAKGSFDLTPLPRESRLSRQLTAVFPGERSNVGAWHWQ